MFLNWSRLIVSVLFSTESVEIDLTTSGTALSKRLPTLELDPITLTKPSNRASKLSNCSGVNDTSPPSRILKINPLGKVVDP